jgi:hypothetical protein
MRAGLRRLRPGHHWQQENSRRWCNRLRNLQRLCALDARRHRLEQLRMQSSSCENLLAYFLCGNPNSDALRCQVAAAVLDDWATGR